MMVDRNCFSERQHGVRKSSKINLMPLAERKKALRREMGGWMVYSWLLILSLIEDY